MFNPHMVSFKEVCRLLDKAKNIPRVGIWQIKKVEEVGYGYINDNRCREESTNAMTS